MYGYGYIQLAGSAGVDIDEIPAVRRGAAEQRAVVAIFRVDPHHKLDVGRGHGHIVAAGDPVLRAEMRVSKHQRRQLGHDVVRVRHAVIGTVCLRRDILGQGHVAQARLAIVILQFFYISRPKKKPPPRCVVAARECP